MQRVLITGAEGFIGRPLVAALSPQADVLTARSVLGRRADLLREDDRACLIDTAKADILIHLAWVTAHGKYWNAPENRDWEVASVDLFHRFYASGGRRVIGIGTCAEYDWTTGAAAFHETAPLGPHTDYGAAKVRTCEGLATLAERHRGSWGWGRVFFSFGPGEPAARLIPAMLRAVLSAEPMDCGPGDTRRDFWDVRNLGAAIAALAQSDVLGPVNLGSGEPISFSDLARMIEDIAGVTGVIRTGQRALGPGEPKAIVADATRLTQEVGFRPEIGLEQGLRDYIAAFEAT